jgi:hypothetical protein
MAMIKPNALAKANPRLAHKRRVAIGNTAKNVLTDRINAPGSPYDMTAPTVRNCYVKPCAAGDRQQCLNVTPIATPGK